MTARKDKNIGVALNRRLDLIPKIQEKVIKQEKVIAGLVKVTDELVKALVLEKRLLAIEERLKILEEQPSVEGEKLLKYLQDINKTIGPLIINDPGVGRE